MIIRIMMIVMLMIMVMIIMRKMVMIIMCESLEEGVVLTFLR